MENENQLTSFQKSVIEKLLEKNIKDCPMCGSKSFGVLDDFYVPVILNDPNKKGVVKYATPMVVISCNNCGFTSQHVAATLGLFPPGKEKN